MTNDIKILETLLKMYVDGRSISDINAFCDKRGVAYLRILTMERISECKVSGIPPSNVLGVLRRLSYGYDWYSGGVLLNDVIGSIDQYEIDYNKLYNNRAV